MNIVPVKLSVKALSSRWNVLQSSPWPVRVTAADVKKALDSGDLESSPNSTRHAQRVAFFVVNPSHDPIGVDVGVPSVGAGTLWPIVDGNHRFAAAIYRQDAYIMAHTAGEVAFLESLEYVDDTAMRKTEDKATRPKTKPKSNKPKPERLTPLSIRRKLAKNAT